MECSQAKLVNHMMVFVENLSLKNLEAFFFVIGPVHVHPRLVILQSWPRRGNALNRHIERRAKEKRDGWFDCALVDFAYPLPITAAGHVAGTSGIDVSICNHNRPGLQRWNAASC